MGGTAAARVAELRAKAGELLTPLGLAELPDTPQIFPQPPDGPYNWLVLRLSEHPAHKAGELDIPPAQRRVLLELERRGVVFDELFIAHEIAKAGRYGPLKPRAREVAELLSRPSTDTPRAPAQKALSALTQGIIAWRQDARHCGGLAAAARSSRGPRAHRSGCRQRASRPPGLRVLRSGPLGRDPASEEEAMKPVSHAKLTEPEPVVLEPYRDPDTGQVVYAAPGDQERRRSPPGIADLVLTPDRSIVATAPGDAGEPGPVSRIPQGRMAAASWDQIAQALRDAEEGRPGGTDVELRSGQLVLTNRGKDSQPVSRLPQERMAAANIGPSQADVAVLRRLDPNNTEQWSPVLTDVVAGWTFRLTPPIPGQAQFVFFTFRPPSDGNAFRIAVLRPDMDVEFGHGPAHDPRIRGQEEHPGDLRARRPLGPGPGRGADPRCQVDGLHLQAHGRSQPGFQPVTAALAGQSVAALDAAPVRVTDGLLTAIRDRLAAVPPERGGAMLACGDLLHLLAEDTSGQYSGASWDISAELSAAVGQLEAAGHGTLAGTVHTHPAGVPDPSGTDIATMRQALDLNPHLSQLVIAVVTEGAPREHDLPIGDRHRMSLHLLRRAALGTAAPVRAAGEVVPLCADLALAGITLESAAEIHSEPVHCGDPPAGRTPLPGVVRLNRRPRLAVPLPGDRPAALFIDPGYPQTGPIAVTGALDSDGTAALSPQPSPWDPVSPSGPQLAALARAAVGQRIGRSTERTVPLVGPLAGAKVLVAGAGSVGSQIAEDLVRSGVGALAIIDPDPVEAPNLSRTVYTAADIGTPKPDALAARLRAIDPAVQVDRHVSSLGLTHLGEALDGISLVIAATDDMSEQALLAHHAYAAGIPLVACALYKAAAAGEVVISVPVAETACWSCAVGSGTPTDQYRPERDYGLGGRLAGEAALGPSIHLVTSVASSVALGLLAGPDSAAGQPLTRLLAENRTLGLIATTANWDFFRQVFAGMDHQHAPQSVWVRIERSVTCPVCGSTPVPPLTEREGEQLVDAIARLREEMRGQDTAIAQAAERQPDPEDVDSDEAPEGVVSRPLRVQAVLNGSLVIPSRLAHAAVAFGRTFRRVVARTRSRGDET